MLRTVTHDTLTGEAPAPAAAPAPHVAAPPRPVVPAAAILGVAVHLPDDVREVVDVERELARRNPGVAPRTPLVSRLTGVRRVHVLPDGDDTSDLAVAASRRLLAEHPGTTVDLLIFASASQDMVEPATSHIVAHKLGLDTVPVMDVKNACNSVLNGVEVAEALVATGRYRNVLVASGEAPSRAVRHDVPDRATYALSAPGYTMSDAGAAVLVGPPPAVAPGQAPRGILASAFSARSEHWDVGMLPGGGTAHPRDVGRTYFEIDGGRLREAFCALGPGTVHEALERAGLTLDDVALVAVHQVALAYLDDVHDALGLPRDRTLVTVADHGNVASVTLPLQLVRARETGRVGDGDVVLLLGLAGGISIGATLVRL